jgi:hypothetical protein
MRFLHLMQGQPWFAWEWLYDIALGILHRACGLNGVVWLCALLVAATLTLLLSQLLRRGTGLPLAIALMLLAEGAATIHRLRAPAHCELAVFAALVCGAGKWWEQWPRIADRCSSVAVGGAASDQRSLTRWIPVALPRLDGAVGEPAWWMDFRHSRCSESTLSRRLWRASARGMRFVAVRAARIGLG